MIDLSETTISARARIAEALVKMIEADRRVRRWRRVEFAEDGGAVISVELQPEARLVGGESIARELEWMAMLALPKLRWVMVQPE